MWAADKVLDGSLSLVVLAVSSDLFAFTCSVLIDF